MTSATLRKSELKGIEERLTTKAGFARRPNLNHFYSQHLQPLLVHDYEFSLAVFRAAKFREIDIDTTVEGFSWDDSAAALSGELNLRRPESGGFNSLPILRGHVVRCQVRRRSGPRNWTEVWRMRCGFPDIDYGEGTVTVPLSDDLQALDRGKHQWRFNERKHNREWRSDELAVKILHQLGVPPGRIAKGTFRHKRFRMKDATGLQALTRIYKAERNDSGRRYVIRMNNGKVDILPYRRNSLLYVLNEQIEEAMLSEAGKDRPTTIILAHGRVGNGNKARKVYYTARNRDVIRRLGAIKEEVAFGKVDSRATLKKKAKRRLAQGLRTNHTATVNHAGIPFIRRGDGSQLVLPGDYFDGKHTAVYVKGASHQVEGPVYTMSLDINTDDPFKADKERRIAEQKDIKRKKREAKKSS